MSNPSIVIDPLESRKFDISIDLQKIYYHFFGYQRTSKKLYEISQKAGFNFTLTEVQEWLERQALHQIHKPQPKFIPCVSFSNITVPFEVLQLDIIYMPYDKVDDITYMFCLNCIDIASRYKGDIAIGTSLNILNMDKFSLEGILTSAIVAEAFVNFINDLENLFSWNKIKLIITDRGSEFKGDFEKLLKKRKIKNQKANFKSTMGFVERSNRTLCEKLFKTQDAQELILPFPQRSRVWKKNLSIVYALLNNTITRLIGMTPNKACKKKHVYAKSSKSRNGPMGFDEVRLSYNFSVRYLLNPGELEGGRRRATDCNWFPLIYSIKKSMVQKNQPVLYWVIDENGDEPERSFVREQLMVVRNVEYPPKWVLKS